MSDGAFSLSLGSLIRKAAIDAGFDLEPERDGAWWRLRASGARGVAWVRQAPGQPTTLSSAPATLLALPLATQLAELELPMEAELQSNAHGAVALPASAAGAVRCASPAQLHAALRRTWLLRAHAPDALRDRWQADVVSAVAAALPDVRAPVRTFEQPDDAPLVTEALAEMKRRVGQDIYRAALLDYWGGQCAVTGLAIHDLLRASHAKPWAVATDVERMDVHNGLLLAVHLDALFDRGLLTFTDEGRGILSPQLPHSVLDILGLHTLPLCLRRVHPDHLPYLSYHRSNIFRSR